jgi:F420-dependent oxidoreductase-like protein
MKFGLFTSIGGITWPQLQSLWQHIEETGWDAACVTDHFMPNVRDPVEETLECWTALAGLALTTKRMRIGTLVTGNTYRHPAVVAKMAANVDIMSGGRLICGLGAGWQKNEHLAYGIPFYTVGERLSRLDEACQIVLGLWAGHKTSFQGRFYQLQEAPLYPKTVQHPHPELLIGGGGEWRSLKIAAKYADHWNCWAGPETMAHKIRVLNEHCAAAGRDPRDITRSANMPLLFTEKAEKSEQLIASVTRRYGWPEPYVRDLLLAGSPAQIQDKLGRLRDVGIDQVFIPTFLPPWKQEALDRLITDVAPALR